MTQNVKMNLVFQIINVNMDFIAIGKAAAEEKHMQVKVVVNQLIAEQACCVPLENAEDIQIYNCQTS